MVQTGVWMWRQCRNGDHPLRAWISAGHATVGRPPRRLEWGLPASVLANLQRSIDSARLSPRSARGSDQIGKDWRWGRLSGDDNGRRWMATHGGRGRRDRGERRPASAAGEEAEALALRVLNNAGAGSRGRGRLGLSPIVLEPSRWVEVRLRARGRDHLSARSGARGSQTPRHGGSATYNAG
jgi:hypothetical protein